MQEIYEWLTNVYNFLGGIIMIILGYLLPIKDLIHFITLLFILDVVIGYWWARKRERAKFKTKIIWNKTMPRWLFSVIILGLLYYWDKVHHQDWVSSYYVGGYFLSGTIIASIVDNALKITGWGVFKGLKHIITSNVEKNTGEKIQEDDNNRSI